MVKQQRMVGHRLGRLIPGKIHKIKVSILCCLLFLSSFLSITIAHVYQPSRVIGQELLATNNPSITKDEGQRIDDPPSLVERGRTFYEAGQFAEAAKVLQQAADAFQGQGDQLRQAMALSNLSLAYQQLGQWSEATQANNASLEVLNSLSGNSKDRLKLLAQALEVQGRLYFAQGQIDPALSGWQQAVDTYRQAGDELGVAKAQINQAQAFQASGLYRRALDTLAAVNQTLQSQPDSSVKATALRSLGNSLRLVGKLDCTPLDKQPSQSVVCSRRVLEKSLAVAKAGQFPQEVGAALLSLGNTARAEADTKGALEYYQQAATTATSPTTKIQAQLNQLSLLLETKDASAAAALWPQIRSQLKNLPPSRASVDARINLAQSLMKLLTATRVGQLKTLETDKLEKPTNPQPSNLQPSTFNPSLTPQTIATLLAEAIQEAKSLKDPRAESYAQGQLGALYEQSQQWQEAINLTQQALLLAQSINAADIAYRWQWQLGRLLKAQEDPKSAIAAYTQAVENLKSLRSDLVAVNTDLQFSFRETVEPVYRELVGLLLQPQGGGETSQENIKAARGVIESLQLAELDNFFRAACLNASEVEIDKLDQKAAIVYPIILSDRLEVIVSLPDDAPLHHYPTKLPQSEIEKTVEQLRQTLVTRTSRKYIPHAQKVYEWLIKPAEADLEKAKVKTLVFVLDGVLRNVPMAALYDGKKHLVEKYSVGLTPGLQLLAPKPLAREDLKALTAGLTEAREDFAALPQVNQEFQTISSEVPTKVLLNDQFTSDSLEQAVAASSYPIVHIATHGEFSSNAKDTFILAWNKRINVNELDGLLRSREQKGKAIELLVLSACKTASGDKRAALGLAGVAVRAGARTTLATLWYVSDAATAQVMGEFYKELTNPAITKAEAVRLAQLTLLKNEQYRHPYYWAPFVLVGNWL